MGSVEVIQLGSDMYWMTISKLYFLARWNQDKWTNLWICVPPQLSPSIDYIDIIEGDIQAIDQMDANPTADPDGYLPKSSLNHVSMLRQNTYRSSSRAF